MSARYQIYILYTVLLFWIHCNVTIYLLNQFWNFPLLILILYALLNLIYTSLYSPLMRPTALDAKCAFESKCVLLIEMKLKILSLCIARPRVTSIEQRRMHVERFQSWQFIVPNSNSAILRIICFDLFEDLTPLCTTFLFTRILKSWIECNLSYAMHFVCQRNCCQLKVWSEVVDSLSRFWLFLESVIVLWQSCTIRS